MSVVWTEDQKKVIDTREKNLLVSAAAGSGKTAVLVERILSLITDPEHPVDADRLLVTTFTKAAASQMRERIGKALAERILEDPGNEWLQRQEALLSRAQITTIHGFCLYVIRNYFHTIDLNPSFRIADEGEMRLLKQDTAQKVVEEACAAKDPDFLRFAESYGSGNRGSGLEELVLQLYEYAQAHPQPEKWLKDCAALYELPKDASWEDFRGTKEIMEELKRTVSDCRDKIFLAEEMARAPYGPLPYIEVLRSDAALLEEMLRCGSMESFGELLADLKFQRLPSRRSKAMADADEGICGRIMEIRNDMKDILKSLKNQYFQLPSETVFHQMRETAQNARCLADLTLQFTERLEEEKRRKNILDFSDQEHFALKILTREEEGKLVPSGTADVFSKYFAEIMVDEYQDSNLVQEAILESISGSRQGRDNRFMVGDVKQSIYRFRQAEPGLFLEKYHDYQDGKTGVRIDLHQNFRSRGEVLGPVNEIFRKIMRRELGGIDYGEAEALRMGASYPDQEGCRAELLLLSQEEWEETRQESRWTKQEAEAHLIAARIRELLKTGTVTEDGELRPARCGDIVILLRTMAGWSETFVRVLQEEGIPASAQSREGYFQTVEVEGLLSYLRVLDNPTQEIPLAAALHGSIGGFSSEELAKIKAAYPEKRFCAACALYASEGPDANLKERLADFFSRVEEYRRRAACTSIHELLWQIVEETGYMDEMRALPGGEQRIANVEMLLQKAQDYEKISYHGLFHFIRYIEKMQKYQVDFGEAPLSGADGGSVQIMSIHHSKGLEFPVVFAAGMGKSFNRQESRDKLVCHSRYGIGLDYVDLEHRMRRATLVKQMIRRQNQLDNLGEELRILYVAMTRAKEKLILTGMAGEKLLQAEPSPEEKLSYLELSGADSYLDWILPALKAEGSALERRQVSLKELLAGEVKTRVQDALSREEMERRVLFPSGDQRLDAEVDRRLSWKYPWADEKTSRQKYSVTELKKLRMEEESDAAEEMFPESDVIPLIPQFIEKQEEKTGAARGTAYHAVMECMDFGKDMETEEQAGQTLEELAGSGRLERQDIDAVNVRDLLKFIQSPLGKRMQDAARRGNLYREQPFVIGLPGDQVDGSDPEELVLIQGIIDAFFYEEDEIVIVDYKTDRIFRAEELAGRYRAQLQYYGKALEMMTGKKVREKVIYSFTMGKVIVL